MVNLRELTLTKQVHQKSVCFVIIGTLKVLNLTLSQIFLINVLADVSFHYWTEKTFILGVFYGVLVKMKPFKFKKVVKEDRGIL